MIPPSSVWLEEKEFKRHELDRAEEMRLIQTAKDCYVAARKAEAVTEADGEGARDLANVNWDEEEGPWEVAALTKRWKDKFWKGEKGGKPAKTSKEWEKGF